MRLFYARLFLGGTAGSDCAEMVVFVTVSNRAPPLIFDMH